MRFGQRSCARASALALMLLMAVGVAAAGAADGDVDPSFSEDGFAFKRLPPQNHGTGASAIAVDAAGRVTVGLRHVLSTCHICVPTQAEYLTRFNPDGSLDRGFGSAGVVQLRPGYRSLYGARIDIAIQADGAVVVALSNGGDNEYYVTRRLPDGSPDPGFGGGDGVVSGADVDSLVLSVEEIGLTDDQRIVTIGSSYDEQERPQVAIARLLSDGTLDRSFSHDGWLVDTTVARLGGGAALSDGRVIVLARPSRPGQLALRYLPDGSLDPAFAEGGTRRLLIGGIVSDVAVDSAGRATFIASSSRYNKPSFVGRLDETGALDPTFADGSLVGLDYRLSIVNRKPLPFGDLALDPAGRPVVAALDRGVIIGRLTQDGHMDRTFSEDGWTETHVRHGEFSEGPVGDLAIAGNEIFVGATVSGGPPSEDRPRGGAALLNYLSAANATAIDADADGTSDRSDECPMLFRRCPRLDVSIHALYRHRGNVVRGYVRSGYDACQNARVLVFRRRPGPDRRVAAAVARWEFKAALTEPAEGRYYALVKRRQLGYGTCPRTSSQLLTVG